MPNMSVGPEKFSGKLPIKPLKAGMGLYQVLYWPKLAPDKDKPWAIVNLQTGDVNGRWHPSKEEALTQARALYANLGDKAKVHGEVHNAYFIFADPATLVADDGVKWVEAIAPKSYHTPAYGEVEVDIEKIDNFVNSVNSFVRGQDIAINYEHGQDPSKGHKAAGWIRQARKNSNGNLELAIDFTEPAKKELKDKEWRYFSLEWDDEWQHPDGVIYKDVIMGGALTNRPVAKGLMPINFSEIFSENEPAHQFATWNTAYVNSLPDSSFAYIESGGKKDSDGKTVPRSLRHFPYKDASGKVDLAHVRNMVARAPQANVPQAVVDRVQTLGRKLLGATNMTELVSIDTEFHFESAEWEHSEPGTGPAPQIGSPEQPDPGVAHYVPRKQGDPDSEDPAIGGGWRRQTPPVAYELSELKKFSEQDSLNYLDSAAKAMQQYIDSEDDYYDKACANDLISQIYRMQASVQADIDEDAADGGSDESTEDQPTLAYMSELAEKAHTELKKMEAFKKAKADDKGVSVTFSEAEAVGYLQASVKGLERIHTNKGNYYVEDIQRLLATPVATRSFNELQRLVSDVRTYLRSNGADDKSGTKSFTEHKFEGGKTVGELTDRDLVELRHVLDVDDDGNIVDAVKRKFGELAALRDSVSASEQERIFAEQYPQFYEQHMKLMERDRNNSARTFSESIEKVRKQEGLGLKTTRMGLSQKAKEKIEEVHVKFSEGRGTINDFEETLKLVLHGGLVQFGEVGTSSDDEIPEYDSTSATGIATARKLFGETVAKIQAEQPDLSFNDALNLAAKKHPDLAEAYSVALPA